MKIALVMEWSQSEKNELVFNTLKKVAEANGHTVDNYGQYNMKDHRMTYNQCAILTSTILNSGAADFVVTGCGTGEGATLAANSMPGVECGLCLDPSDSYLFTQINAGNAIAIPYAKGFGWGAEINLEYIFEKLFVREPGGGYPDIARESEKANKKILDGLKAVSHHDIKYILANADKDLVKASFGGPNTMALLEKNAKDKSIVDAVKAAIA